MPYGGLAPTILTCAAVGLGDGIQSVNIVGYYNVTCDKDYNLVPVNLLKVVGGQIALDDLIPSNTVNLTKYQNKNSADIVKVYTGDGYIDFWCHNGKGSGGGPYAGKWVYLNGSKITLASESEWSKFEDGDCFFFVPKQTGNPVVLSIPGQVPSTAPHTLAQGYNLIGSGFPADFYLNGEVNGSNMTNYWTEANGFTLYQNKNSADKIKVYQGTGLGYVDYWLHNGKGSGGKPFAKKWVYLDGSTTKEVTDPIPADTGFFFQRFASGEIPFNPPVPYSL